MRQKLSLGIQVLGGFTTAQVSADGKIAKYLPIYRFYYTLQ